MKKTPFYILLALTLGACSSPDTPEAPQRHPEGAVEETTPVVDEAAPVEVDQNLEPIDSEEARIATALMACPEGRREGATVIGFNDAGEFVTMKEGNNEMICLADDPNKEGFSAACYHKELEPFMARGRELRAEGKNGGEVFDIREEEVKSGKLQMGSPGTTLHIYYGDGTDYNPETSEVGGADYRWVVYLPFATSASTGLPESPRLPDDPWIMNPGSHKAHIMITPQR